MIWPGMGCMFLRQAGDTTPPTVASTAINEITDEIDLTGVSEAGTYYGVINYSATVLTGSDIFDQYTSGAPDAEISFAVVTGANAGIIDKSLVPPGTAYLHGTVKDAAGNYSVNVPLAFTQPAPFYVNQTTNSVELVLPINELTNLATFTIAGHIKSAAVGATINRIAQNGKCWFAYKPSTTEFYVVLKNTGGSKIYEAHYNTFNAAPGTHFIFACDGTSVGLWVDGVEQTASSVAVAYTGAGVLDVAPAWNVLSDVASNSLDASEVGQFIVDDVCHIDFTSAATKAASVRPFYNNGTLKDFSNLSSTPAVALGDTMVLADWNKATSVVENLGTGVDLSRTGVFT